MQASAVQPQSVSISSTWPEHCKRWVGQVVESRFHLRQFLGGSDHSAVFLTKPSDRRNDKAAIKFIKSDPRTDDEQLARWQRMRHMQCPGLLEIYEYGRCEIGDTHLLYVVEEFADETLAGVLPERALTTSEVEQMLPAVLDTLSFAHSKGLALSRLKPSNVMAVGDRLKLSPECVLPFGAKSRWADLGAYAAPELLTGVSTATDVWALGVLIRQALTQNTEADTASALSAPYDAVVKACTAPDPARRCSLPQVRQMLAQISELPARSESAATLGAETVSPAKLAPMKTVTEAAPPKNEWWSELAQVLGTPRLLAGVATAIAVLLAIVLGLNLRHTHASAPAPQVIAQQPVRSTASVVAERAAATPAPKVVPTADTTAGRINLTGPVLHEALPRVPQSASNTITGTVRVKVRVAVDSDGKVRDAELEQAGPSKYFARLSMEAARDWRFAPKAAQGMWLLNFNYRRSGPSASAAPAS